jgi:shikimate dehydrogenase
MFVITLPSSATKDPKAYAERAASAGADILEIRGDLTPDVQEFDSPLPLLVSPRRSGKKLIEQLKPQYIDLELDENCELSIINSSLLIIRSFHDHEKTPSLDELKEIAEQLIALKPDIIKIVTTINSYLDIVALTELRNSLPKDLKHVILGMGVKAHLTRMLSPLRNELTYTYLDEGEEAAPGQVPLSLHKLTSHCKNPKIFGIIGSLDVKSGSPLIQNSLFHTHEVDALYTTFLTDDLDDVWNVKEALNIQGFSVTSPFKKEIIEKLDAVDPLVEKLGTVNTAVLHNGKWTGYTRDSDGLLNGYPFFKKASSAAILGSGGVVPAVIHACKESGIADIQIFARNEETRSDLAKKFDMQASALDEVKNTSPDLLINALTMDIDLPIPKAKAGAHAVDLRYHKETKFMRSAKDKGYEVHDGSPMLLQQALAQFTLFTGISPTLEELPSLYSSLKNHGK